MRRFSSYGSIDKEIHYFAPRVELLEHTCKQLLGENPAKGGHGVYAMNFISNYFPNPTQPSEDATTRNPPARRLTSGKLRKRLAQRI